VRRGQRQCHGDRRSAAWRALELEPATEHVDAVGEADQARSGYRSRAAVAVVGDGRVELAPRERNVRIGRDLQGVRGGVRVPVGVWGPLCPRVVDGGLDRGGGALGELALELDRAGRGTGELEQRWPEAPPGQRRWVKAARQLAHVLED